VCWEGSFRSAPQQHSMQHHRTTSYSYCQR
jgi:hypothetical protein